MSVPAGDEREGLRIMPGTKVRVLTASGTWLLRIAVTERVEGGDFPVVWVCTEEEWCKGQDIRKNHALPWPEEDVVADA